MTTPTHGKNDHRWDDYLSDVRKFAQDSGNGRLSRLRIALRTINAAYDGVLDTVKDKHGKGLDDAAFIYAAVSKEEAQIGTHNGKSVAAQASKIRACVKLGGWTRGGVGQPISNVNFLVERHKALKSTGQDVKDCYEAVLKYASVQIKLNQAMEEKDLDQFILKGAKAPVELEDYLAGIQKKLTDLVSGKAGGGTLQDSSPEITLALEGVGQRLAALKLPDEDEDDPYAALASSAVAPGAIPPTAEVRNDYSDPEAPVAVDDEGFPVMPVSDEDEEVDVDEDAEVDA